MKLYPALENEKSLSVAVSDSQSNKNKRAFSRGLKLMKLPIIISSASSLFQSRGPVTSNDLSARWVLVRSTTYYVGV